MKGELTRQKSRKLNIHNSAIPNALIASSRGGGNQEIRSGRIAIKNCKVLCWIGGLLVRTSRDFWHGIESQRGRFLAKGCCSGRGSVRKQHEASAVAADTSAARCSCLTKVAFNGHSNYCETVSQICKAITHLNWLVTRPKLHGFSISRLRRGTAPPDKECCRNSWPSCREAS